MADLIVVQPRIALRDAAGFMVVPEARGFDDPCEAFRFIQSYKQQVDQQYLGAVAQNFSITSEVPDYEQLDVLADFCGQWISVSTTREDFTTRGTTHDGPPPLETPETLGQPPAPEPTVTIQLPAQTDSAAADPNVPPPQRPPSGEPERRSRDEEKQRPTAADPVDLFTGEFYLESVDFELPSIGFPFVFIRTYRSGRSFFGPFGYNWDHNYNVYLRELNNGKVAVNTGRLQEDLYSDSGDSVLYNAPRSVFAKLERQSLTSPYEFIHTSKDGTTQSFARPAGWSDPERIPLAKIEDANGNAQQLLYDGQDRLAAVVDTVGRKIEFIYGACGLLEALRPEFLQTSGGAPVEIKYLHANNVEHLSAVVTFPSQEFPEGLTTCYEYDDQQPLGEQRNNITRVIDAKGRVVVENLYGTDTGDAGFNRVVKQYFTGGEYLFTYTHIRYIPPLDEHVNDAYLQVEFYEPERPLKLYTFNFRGNLLDERYRLCADGSFRVWAQSYRYNKDGQLTEFYHADGMAEVFIYDETNPDPLARGNLLTIELKSRPDGLLTRKVQEFTYDTLFQKLKTVTDEAGETTVLVYDYENDPLVRKGNLKQIVYPDVSLPDGTAQTNSAATFRYDQFGQVVEYVSPAGRKTEFEYNNAGQGAGLPKKITKHDRNGAATESFEYDGLANITTRIDGRGNATLSKYNLLGQLTEYQLPEIGGRRATLRFEYNEDRKVTKLYVPRGSYTDGVIQDDWITHEYLYDAAARLVKEIQNSNTVAPQVTTYTRDVHGNVLKTTNALGQETSYRYDERNLPLTGTMFAASEFPAVTRCSYDRTGNLVKLTQPDGNEQHFDYDENFARLKSQTDHLGVRTEYFYGQCDRVVKTTLSNRAGYTLQTTQYGFDERGRLVTSDQNGITQQIFHDKDGFVLRATNHLGDSLRFMVDGLGRTVAVEDPLGNVARSASDANGNLREIMVESPSAQSGHPVQFSQAMEFDERNRPVQTRDRFGNVYNQVYDDRDLRTEVRDSYGTACRIYYDVNGLPIKSALVFNGSETVLYHWHRDLVGRQIGFEDAQGNITRYEYDNRNNLVRSVYPDGSVLEKRYNSVNLLEAETDPNGSVASYSYDEYGQLTNLHFQPGNDVSPTSDTQYSYDTFGRLNGLVKGSHSIVRAFDSFGRIVEEKQSPSTLKRVYDDDGNTLTLIYPDGREDLYVFDRIGRLKEIVFKKKGTNNLVGRDFTEGTKLVEYGYEGIALVSKRLANGTVTRYTRDGEGKLLSYEVRDSAGRLLDQESYLYDGEKRKRLALRRPLTRCSRVFSYDELSRLTECYTGVGDVDLQQVPSDQRSIDALIDSVVTSNAAGRVSYELTANDRRESWSENNVSFTATYDSLLRLSRVQASDGRQIKYKYDRNGNRVADDRFTYHYDAFDNLVKVADGVTGQVVFEQIFDAEGRIVEKKLDGASTRFVFDGLRVVEEVSGQVGRQNVYGPGLDDLVVQSILDGNFFGHLNDLQSLQCVTDSAGRLIESVHYAPFGEPSVFDDTGNARPASSAVVGPIFAGRPYVHDLGLYEFRRRMYDPKVGAFIQPDALRYVDSPNPYLYCKHNPVSFTDPTGSFLPILIALGIVAADGGLTALGTAVVTGAIVGGVSGIGINAARQNIQIQTGEGKSEFSFAEMFVSGGMGIVAGAGFPLLLAASPLAALGLGVILLTKGSFDIGEELLQGHLYTAGFDLATTLLLPFAGKRLGSLAKGNGAATKGGGPKEVYSLQGDKSKILPNLGSGHTGEMQGRLWGMTEGSVYAHKLQNAPRWMSGANPKDDPVIFKFVGENAEVFQSHETTGLYSLIKNALGQKKAGFGDLTFENALPTSIFVPVPKPGVGILRNLGSGTQVAPIIELLGVKLAPRNFAGQSRLKATSRLWGRRIFEQLFNIPMAAALNNIPEMLIPSSPDRQHASSTSSSKKT